MSRRHSVPLETDVPKKSVFPDELWHKIQDAQTDLRGYPNFLWFCPVRLTEESYFSFSVFARDAEQAKSRTRKALREHGIEYMEIAKPYRTRTHWRTEGER